MKIFILLSALCFASIYAGYVGLDPRIDACAKELDIDMSFMLQADSVSVSESVRQAEQFERTHPKFHCLTACMFTKSKDGKSTIQTPVEGLEKYIKTLESKGNGDKPLSLVKQRLDNCKTSHSTDGCQFMRCIGKDISLLNFLQYF